MTDVCLICGLPRDLCMCSELAKETFPNTGDSRTRNQRNNNPAIVSCNADGKPCVCTFNGTGDLVCRYGTVISRHDLSYSEPLDKQAQSVCAQNKILMRQTIDLKLYQRLCQTTTKTFKSKKDELICWGLGIAGEAGDLAGCIKKTIFHDNNQLDGIMENLGDVLWYAAMICNCLDIPLEQMMQKNIEKLKARYPHGFTQKDAARNGTRKDWMEEKKTCPKCGRFMHDICWYCKDEERRLQAERDKVSS